MNLAEAWIKLGFDPDQVYKSISSQPRDLRIAKAYEMLDEAKRRSKKLLGINHPDTGGDPVQFRSITEAIKIIEAETSNFEIKMKERLKEIEEKSKKSIKITIG